MIETLTAMPAPAVAAPPPPVRDCVLLVEDNPDDVFIFQRMLRSTCPATALEVVTDGESAVRWLTEAGREGAPGRSAGVPRAIFLDLQLPGLPGHDVLRWIRSRAEFAATPVVICSASSALTDIATSRRLGADLYFTKYPPPAEFRALMRVPDLAALRTAEKRQE
jgi:CheY-like chemotaxis protein